MNGSCVTPKTAGIESTAKTTSVVSMVSRTRKSGVMASRPSRREKNLPELYPDVTGKKRACEADEDVAVRMHLDVFLAEHLPAAHDEDDPEQIENPVETGDQCRAGRDEDRARDQRPDHSPEQRPVMQVQRDGEVREDDDEDKDVVEREGALDEIACQKFQRFR